MTLQGAPIITELFDLLVSGGPKARYIPQWALMLLIKDAEYCLGLEPGMKFGGLTLALNTT